MVQTLGLREGSTVPAFTPLSPQSERRCPELHQDDLAQHMLQWPKITACRGTNPSQAGLPGLCVG